MKKTLWMLLAALCLLWPAGSLAQGLPGFREAIEAGALPGDGVPSDGVPGDGMPGDSVLGDGAPVWRAPLTDGALNRGEPERLGERDEQDAEVYGPVMKEQAAEADGESETDAPDDGVPGDGEPDDGEGATAFADGVQTDDAPGVEPERDAEASAVVEDSADGTDAPGDGVSDDDVLDDSRLGDGEPGDGEPGDDLTLTLVPGAIALSEGERVALVIAVTNPRAVKTPVTLTLNLPERLGCDGETAWEAVLPAAEEDAEGHFVPSVTTFRRELSLGEGGVGETVTLTAELGMGARFYRAQAELELRVSDVSVRAVADGTTNGRVQPGDAFAYRIDVTNAGTASRDVAVELTLPEGLTLAGELPEGFEQAGDAVRGTVHAAAATKRDAQSVASAASVTIPVSVDSDALDGEDDATRLLTGTLRIDGERVSLPRVQVCAAQITARLIPEADSLEAGAQMNLRIVVANTGLAPANVRVSCLLPEGLTLAKAQEETPEPEGVDAALPPDDGASAQGAAMLTEEAELPVLEPAYENQTLIYDVYMDAASEADGGVVASTREITVRVQADSSQSALREKLVGAALAYETDGGTQLAQAVAVRVYTPAFLGVTRDEWGGIFWAVVLLTVTIGCLYAAVKVVGEDEEKEYCLD